MTQASTPGKKPPPLPKKVGSYTILSRIAIGGMGEIYLAKDPNCHRKVALKRIRPELLKYKILRKRFLREAFLTASLTHPTIIPIFSIHEEKDSVFYTMPYVEGETLKHLLRKAKKKKLSTKESTSSIKSLTRIFLSICEAVSYIHSQGIIHRDLKPENILVGNFGEVLILDWGLAKSLNEECRLEDAPEDLSSLISGQITAVGKVVGTPSYLAPERAKGKSPSPLTDIYALGVILYYILALKLPFNRESIKEFIQNHEKEELIPPSDLAPYRDIPKALESIALKSLSFDPRDRYQNVDSLLSDLTAYLEGRAEWFPLTELSITEKNDWEFQENILLTKPMALTRNPLHLDWVNLMISKEVFPGNLMLRTKVRIAEEQGGIGLLLQVPRKSLRKQPNDGFCVWFSASEKTPSKLFRGSHCLLEIHEATLSPNTWHTLTVEKEGKRLSISIDGCKKLSYIHHTPLQGDHIGVLLEAPKIETSSIEVFSGSQSAKVSCLSVPEAFLSKGLWEEALSEYRKVSRSFPGRAEGREALFQSGITLLEQAKHCSDIKQSQGYLAKAFDEFEKLGPTPGASLEYLGKACIYQYLHENQEEVKCLELAIRKFRQHPLLYRFEEYIAYRLQESAQQDRLASYRFMLLLALFFPKRVAQTDILPLFQDLSEHWDLPYLFPSSLEYLKGPRYPILSLILLFWVDRSVLFTDLAQRCLEKKLLDEDLIVSCFLSLLELGDLELAEKFILSAKENFSSIDLLKKLLTKEKIDAKLLEKTSYTATLATFLANTSLYLGEAKKTALYLPYLPEKEKNLISLSILLLEEKWKEAKFFLEEKKHSFHKREFLFFSSCLAAHQEGLEKALELLQKSPLSFDHTYSLLPLYLTLAPQNKRALVSSLFFWEKKQLSRQLFLFFHCAHDPQQKSLQAQNLKDNSYDQL